VPEKYADVQIRWDNIGQMLDQIDEIKSSSEDGILLNFAYSDYRGLNIEDALDAIKEEVELLSEIAAADWDTDEAEEVIESHTAAFGATPG
jgi:hypothetical protein